MLGRVLFSLFTLLIFAGLAVAMICSFAENTYRYTGQQEFETLEEAYSFQQEVINEAVSIDAKIKNVGVSVQSPPTVSWDIKLHQPTVFHVNDNHEFPYGSKKMSKGDFIWSAGGLLGFFGPVFLLMAVGSLVYGARKRNEK